LWQKKERKEGNGVWGAVVCRLSEEKLGTDRKLNFVRYEDGVFN